MKIRYTTGEFAALCGVKKDTLFHYDAIGLLKPAYVGENGYRYYTLNQFKSFDTISILKQAGTPLEEIRAYLNSSDPRQSLALLKEKLAALQREEQRIRMMQQSLRQTVASIQEGVHCECGVLRLQELPEQYLIATPTHFDRQPDEKAMLALLRDHFAYCEKGCYGERFQAGTIIFREHLLSGVFVEDCYFNPLPEKVQDPRLLIKPAGLYAVMYHQGDYDTLPDACRLLLREIAARGCRAAGDLYEDDVIDYFWENNPSRYVLKLSVPVVPLENVRTAQEAR